jgi:putative NADH-flavin reductase
MKQEHSMKQGDPMKLTIVAATGGIGRHLLEQAIAAGHDVTAVVRSPQKVTAPVRVIEANLAQADPATLENAVKGADAVLSGLGARTSAEAGVARRGTQSIIDAMWSTDVRRIVVVSAAPIGTVPSPSRPHPPKHDAGDGFFMRHLGARFARTMFRTHYADLARMEDLLRDSGLDWTISRPPKLTDKPLTGQYRTADGQNIRGGFSISRADVAHQMLQCLTDESTIRHIIGVAH